MHTNDEATTKNEHQIPRHLTPPPFIPELFQGRDDDLHAVHQKLFAGNNLLLLANCEGGIGKTTLVAKYWQRYEPLYKHTAWVFAQKNLLDALLTLALPLQVDFPEAMPAEERLVKLLAAMANLDKPCLLIIDNANDARELAKHYQALRSCPNFHLLITTRIPQFEHAEIYPVKPLEEEDALALFKKHYPGHRKDEDDLLKSIRTAIGGNTLVMELLAKNLAAINNDEIFYSLADLLQDLQKRGLLQISQTDEVPIAEKGNSLALKKAQPAAIIETLYDNMEMLGPLTEVEQRLLCNLSVLPAEIMSYSLLKILLAPPDTMEFTSTLAGLTKRGWLEKSKQGRRSFYKISLVTQEITLHKNKANLLAYCVTLLDTLIEKLDYQPGIGHLLNANYEEAAFYNRYAEAAMVCFQEIDYKLSLLCESIGNYHKTTGNLSQALQFFYEYNRLANELYEAYPNDVEFKNNLAISCEKLGTTHTALGNLDQALGWYEGDLRLAKELHEAYPNNVGYKNGLAIACERLGTMHAALGNLDQALGLYEEYHDLAKELYEVDPNNVEFKNGLAVTCQYLGYTHTALGSLDQALAFYETYHHLKMELNEASPDNVQFKNGLAIACGKLGTTHASLGKLDEALGLYEEYNSLEKELHESYPDNMEFKNGLAISCQYLGNTYTEIGNLGQALGFYEEFNRLEKELHEAYPDNMEFKNNLAISLICLGLTFEKVENIAKAREFYEQSKALLEQLVYRSPLDVKFKNNLDWVTARLNES